jgi:hypothetical protein
MPPHDSQRRLSSVERERLRERFMRKTISISLFAMLAGMSVATLASPTAAQDLDPAREAAIRKCVKVAKSVPEGKGTDNQRGAVGAFKACMTSAGHKP